MVTQMKSASKTTEGPRLLRRNGLHTTDAEERESTLRQILQVEDVLDLVIDALQASGVDVAIHSASALLMASNSLHDLYEKFEHGDHLPAEATR